MKIPPSDFFKAYPEEDSPDFRFCVVENWKNLEQGNLEGRNCDASILNQNLGPKKTKKDKFFAFTLWLHLCFSRPWENGWKYSFKIGYEDKIYRALNDFLDDYPDLPDIQKFKYYLRKENSNKIISSLPFEPALMKLRKTLKFVFAPINPNWDQRVFKKLKLISKFIDIIESEPIIKKSDLMRKLRVKKDECDRLLEKAEEDGFVKIQNFPCKRTWVIYNDR